MNKGPSWVKPPTGDGKLAARDTASLAGEGVDAGPAMPTAWAASVPALQAPAAAGGHGDGCGTTGSRDHAGDALEAKALRSVSPPSGLGSVQKLSAVLGHTLPPLGDAAPTTRPAARRVMARFSNIRLFSGHYFDAATSISCHDVVAVGCGCRGLPPCDSLCPSASGAHHWSDMVSTAATALSIRHNPCGTWIRCEPSVQRGRSRTMNGPVLLL